MISFKINGQTVQGEEGQYILQVAEKYGIEIPFPQRDIHLRSAFGKKDEEGLSLLPGRQ